ncbi:uncharacterized protein LOC128867288 [Anastrepha ludens]|uniref:uncharacterized protein LOC128867288 n=1 Tax=Anastrepha ludens TaxID=28586 RepID=UPI0023B12821|nr:uncharacterized protein LOC128867288 [Anastrepha ludens]
MLSLILLTSFIAGVYIYWTYVQYKTGWHLLKKLPGPPVYWVFGNVLQLGFTAEEHVKTIRRWAHVYNYNLARMYGGAEAYVMITNPKDIEQVLSSNTLLYKYDPYNFFYPWLGQGLLTANDRHWVNHRKMITPSFHFGILQDFLKIMNNTTDRFMELLAGFAAKEDMFDFQEIVTRSTIDVICEAAMGTPVNAIQGPTSPMVPAISDICDVMRGRMFSALSRFDFFFVWTKAYRRQKKALAILRKELSEIIEKRKTILGEFDQNNLKSDNDGKRPKMAFLDNLLTAEVDGKPLTFQDIFEEVSTFVFEGHDTTASAIGFTIYSLSRHPEIQERAFQEQYALFGNDVNRSPTYKELGDMKYLELVLKESLRLYPSVPIIARTALEQTEIGGYQIPAGATLACCIITLGTDPNNFPDPFKFMPERFENRASTNPYDYVPFSAGPRNCIGQKFAMMELKVTVSKIIRHFNILPALDGLSTGINNPTDPNDKINNPYDARLGFFLTLKSINGLKIRLRRRTYKGRLLVASGAENHDDDDDDDDGVGSEDEAANSYDGAEQRAENECNISLYGFGECDTKNAVKPMGALKYKIEIDGEIYELEFLVVPSKFLDCEVIIGENFCAYAEVKIDREGLHIKKVENDSDDNSKFFMMKIDIAADEKEIDIDESPIFSRPRRLPIAEKLIVDSQVEQWLSDGIIEASDSEFCSPVVLVKKRDGTPRLCIDFRRLNKVMIKDHFPLPLIEDQLDQLQNAKIFSTIDLRNEFFHVSIAQSSRKYTAFVTHNGQYQFLKVPFGLSNSPSVFQRHINAIFRDLVRRGTVLLYMDDVIIPAQNEESALKNLEEVMQVCKDYGLDINFKKCQFLKTKVEFLGHVVENQKLSPSPEKIEAVTKYKIPQNLKQLQGFLGLAGYFRKFVRNFSVIAKPLSDLTKQNVKFEMKDREIESFQTLKKCLSEKPVLSIFNQKFQTEVHTDASIDGYGAVLLQKLPEDGHLHPIYYMSKKTTEAERKYTSYELEVLAVIEALKKFRVYLLGLHFKLVTDCNAFTKTLDKKDLCTRVARWILFLQEYDYEVEHRAGTQMRHVDALSRYAVFSINDDSLVRLRCAQLQDDELKVILDVLREKTIFNDYFTKGGILYKLVGDDELIVVPTNMQREVIRKAHDNGHFAVKKTMELITKDYYIPKIEEKIQRHIANCIPCIISNRKLGKQEGNSCLNAPDRDININTPWSAQCASPSTPILPHITKTSTGTSSSTLLTIPSQQVALSTLPPTMTSTTNTTTTANTAATTSVCSLAHLISSSAVTSKTSTTSQVQNIYTISPKEPNKQENLKRHRDGQSPNNSNEQMNTNKKHKNKTQNTAQKTLKEYWLDKPNSSNRFELLAQEAETNELHTDSGTEPKTKPQIQTEQRKLKPPPIYVQNVENVHALTTALKSLTDTKYELKALSTNEIKIQPQESIHYTNILKLLKDKETKFYTFRPKDQRGFKVILRNVHHATDKNEIIMELAELGHEGLNIHNIQRIPATPTPPTDQYQNSGTNKQIIPEISYAEALTKNMPSSTSHKQHSPTTNTYPTQQQDDLQELKQMMKQLVAQMTNMMNIITLLIARIKKNKMWFFLLSFLFAPFLCILYLEVKNYSKRKQVNKLPGPAAVPVLGNAHQMGKTPSAVLNQLFQWWQEAGHQNFRVLIGLYRNIVVTNEKDLEFILTSKTLIDKSDIYDMLHPWLGTGLLTATGHKWQAHRKIITPSFHFKILQSFHAVMNKNSNKFIEKLRNTSRGDAIFDFQEMTHYLTMDVICDTAMGVHINAMDNHDNEVVQAFKDMCYNTNMRAYHPIKRSHALYRFMPDYPKYCKTLKILHNFTNEVIIKRIEALKLAEGQSKEREEDEFSNKKLAFLDNLLSSTIDGEPLTQQEIYEEVSTFMFTGHDTTTSGIAFTVYLISLHPDIQKKVYAEQQQIMGDNLTEATFQQIAEMQYLDMVVKETLRLYPSVPVVARRTEKDYDINGYVVPEDTTINLFLMALGYNDKYFPDPYRVDPERWNVNERIQNPFEYLPFSAGARNCIGQKFALLEIKTVVSKIVRAFNILPPLDELTSANGYSRHFIGLPAEQQRKRLPNPSKYDPILSAVLTLKSENGIYIRLRERS